MADVTVAAPAYVEKPGRGGGVGGGANAAEAWRERFAVAGEPLGGRAGVERTLVWAGRGRSVFSAILEHIDECVADLAGGRERIAVPAICPEAASAKYEAIEAASEPDC